jgi:hypothetical protein
MIAVVVAFFLLSTGSMTVAKDETEPLSTNVFLMIKRWKNKKIKTKSYTTVLQMSNSCIGGVCCAALASASTKRENLLACAIQGTKSPAEECRRSLESVDESHAGQSSVTVDYRCSTHVINNECQQSESSQIIIDKRISS